MSRGFPSMTALLGLLAVAGYQIEIRSRNSCVERSAILVPFLRKNLSLVAPAGREIWAGCWRELALETC